MSANTKPSAGGDKPFSALALLGVQASSIRASETAASVVGGILAIAGVIGVSGYFVGPDDAGLLVASMGASAVLLFAVPDGALSQPWALLCGNLASACVGVTCARFIPDTTLAAACAVGIAIGVMQQLRCVHPPGGATALSAVVGGPGVHALGYGYVLTPVLINVLVILTVALVFHVPFRRYPASLRPASK